MTEAIQFTNIEADFEKVLRDRTLALVGQSGVAINYNAHYERDSNGFFNGTIHALTAWGEVHATTKDLNIHQMYHRLKKKVRAQINHKWSMSKFIDHLLEDVVDEPADYYGEYDFPNRVEKNFTPVSFGGYPDPLYVDYSPIAKPHILMVDDDVDTLLSLDNVFRQFGCQTSYALDANDATKKITSGKPDIIILDWLVGKETGGDIIEKSLKKIRKYHDLEVRVKSKSPKIVTYSGVDQDKLIIPESDYFLHIGHWQKPLLRADVVKKTTNLLNRTGF